MTITVDAELAAVLIEQAQKQGTTPEQLAADALRARFPRRPPPIEPRDEWERRLLGIGVECGVVLPDSALTAEGLYE